MDAKYDDSPEVAPSRGLPEVYHPSPSATYTVPSTLESKDFSPYAQNHSSPSAPVPFLKKRLWRCSVKTLLVALLILALLAAVIGLAVGNGILASQLRQAHVDLDNVAAQRDALETPTASADGPVKTSYADITNGCSAKKESTTGQKYISRCSSSPSSPPFHSLPNQLTKTVYNNETYTMHCNRNAPNAPLYSLFAPDFNACMEACTAWTNYNGTSDKCEAVSFVPLWTDLATAAAGNAPGDCYLKGGPQSVGKLEGEGLWTETHSALLEVLE